LLAEAPANFTDRAALDDASRRWIARAGALISSTRDQVESLHFNSCADHLGGALHTINANSILSIIHRALATAELAAPGGVQGAFIPVGAGFDAFQAIGKVLGTARRDALIVDPYMGLAVLTDYARLAAEEVVLRLLADSASVDKDKMRAGLDRWRAQFKRARSIEMRLTPPRALHDRLIVIDAGTVWSLTQSLEHFASRSPASVVRVDGDVGDMKRRAYETLWETATLL